jgi:hypothetical protein
VGLFRRPDLDDVDVESCLANLDRIAYIDITRAVRKHVLDLRGSEPSEATVRIDVDEVEVEPAAARADTG